MAQFNIQGTEGTKKKKKKRQDNPTVTTVPTKKTELPIIKKVEDKKTSTIVPTEDKITAVVEPEKTLLSSTEVTTPQNNTPTESLEDIINRTRREREIQNALKRQQTIAQGTTNLQGSLDRTNQSINQQQDSLDPRFGAAKGSAVAGTRVAQNRLASVTPFSGQQAGRTLRQAQGIESDLQGRQSELDSIRADEEQGIALRRQQATQDYNQGLQSLQQGATLAETESNIRANELADANLLQQTQNRLTDESNALQQRKQEFADTISRFSQDYQAEINRVSNDGDPSNDWQIAPLQAARQAKILGIEQNQANIAASQQEALTNFEQETYDRAIKAWNEGIPLNANEASVLGLQAGATKPRTSSSGTSGLSASGTSSLAKWKIEQGYPLTAGEGKVIGLPEGYIQPGATPDGTQPPQTINDIMDSQVTFEDLSDNTKAKLEAIINNPQLYDGNDPVKLLQVLKDAGVTVYELDVYEAWKETSIPTKPLIQ